MTIKYFHCLNVITLNVLKALQSLFLSQNWLTTLDECVFADPGFYNARIMLYLGNNPWVRTTFLEKKNFLNVVGTLSFNAKMDLADFGV